MLFRLADELDIGCHRAPINVLDNYKIPTGNAMFWYINYISDCNISKINSISLKISLSKKDYNELADDMKKIITNFYNKNISLVELLNAKDFVCSINSITSSIHIDYTKKELPQSIIDAIYLDLYHTKKLKIPDISMNEEIMFSLITPNNQFED